MALYTTLPADCEHKTFRYPNLLPPEGRRCGRCGALFQRSSIWDGMSEEEIEDAQAIAMLIATVLMGCRDLHAGIEAELMPKEVVKRTQGIKALHEMVGREPDLVSAWRKLGANEARRELARQRAMWRDA